MSAEPMHGPTPVGAMDRAAVMAWIESQAASAGRLADPSPAAGVMAERSVVNPTCGDRVLLRVHRDGQGQLHVRGSVDGCTLSTAATVVASEAVERLDLDRARFLIGVAVTRRLTGADLSVDGDLGLLAGLPLVPLRRRCVALPWQALSALLEEVS